MPVGIPLHSGMAASLHQNDKQGGAQTPTQYTHIKTLVYTARQISVLSWMLPALCWCKERTVVASAILFAIICWGCGRTKRDRKRLNKLVKRATSDLRPIWDEHPSWTICMRLEAITVSQRPPRPQRKHCCSSFILTAATLIQTNK